MSTSHDKTSNKKHSSNNKQGNNKKRVIINDSVPTTKGDHNNNKPRYGEDDYEESEVHRRRRDKNYDTNNNKKVRYRSRSRKRSASPKKSHHWYSRWAPTNRFWVFGPQSRPSLWWFIFLAIVLGFIFIIYYYWGFFGWGGYYTTVTTRSTNIPGAAILNILKDRPAVLPATTETIINDNYLTTSLSMTTLDVPIFPNIDRAFVALQLALLMDYYTKMNISLETLTVGSKQCYNRLTTEPRFRQVTFALVEMMRYDICFGETPEDIVARSRMWIHGKRGNELVEALYT